MRVIKGGRPVFHKAENLTRKDYKTVIKSNEFVFLWFYAEWCQGWQDYGPEFDKAANELAKLYPKEEGKEKSKLAVMKVNCSDEKVLAEMFNIGCYPLYILVRNGQVIHNCYIDKRKKDEFVKHVKQFVGDPIDMQKEEIHRTSSENKSSAKHHIEKKNKYKRRDLREIQDLEYEFQY